MFAKLKEDGLTFTDFFADFPMIADKENFDLSNQETDLAKLNLYQYLKAQKRKREAGKARSRTQEKLKQSLSNRQEATVRNISKVSIDNKSSFKGSLLVPQSLCFQDDKDRDSALFKKHRTALLDSKKTDALSRMLKINEKDSKSLTYRSNNHKMKSFLSKATTHKEIKSQLFEPGKKRLNCMPNLSLVKKSQEPVRRPKPRKKPGNLDVLNLKTIESCKGADPSPRYAMGRPPFNPRSLLNKPTVSERPVVGKKGNAAAGGSSAKENKPKNTLGNHKVDVVLAAIQECVESSKQSFCEKTLKLDSEKSKTVFDIPESSCFITEYASELEQYSADPSDLKTKLDNRVLTSVLDWVFELSSELEYTRITTHLAARFLLIYLTTMDDPDLDNLQLDALGCLLAAGKLEEVRTPDPKKLVRSLESKCTFEDLIDGELRVLNLIKPYIVNHNAYVLLQAVQVRWDNFVGAEPSRVACYFGFLPCFRSKSFDSYTLHKISSEMLDYSVTMYEFLEEPVSRLVYAVFIQALLQVSTTGGEDLVELGCAFLAENRLIMSKERFKATVKRFDCLKKLKFSMSVPLSDEFKTYEDFLLSQTYNPELFRLSK